MKSLVLVLVFLAWFAVPARADFVAGRAAYERGDYANALREWKPLAQKGDAFAQFNLGRMYHEGQGVPQDYKEAVRWYRLAAEQGLKTAQFNLGTMYAKGQGVVSQDYVQAHMWFNLAAAQGVENASVARDHIAKKMIPAEIAEARKLAREWKPKK